MCVVKIVALTKLTLVHAHTRALINAPTCTRARTHAHAHAHVHAHAHAHVHAHAHAHATVRTNPPSMCRPHLLPTRRTMTSWATWQKCLQVTKWQMVVIGVVIGV